MVVVSIVVGRAFDLPTAAIMGVIGVVTLLIASGVDKFGPAKYRTGYSAPGYALMGLGILVTTATELISGWSEMVDVVLSVLGSVLIIGGVVILFVGIKKKAGDPE